MAIFTASLFEFIGEVFIYVLAFVALLVLIALLQLVVSMRVHKFVFPRFQSVLLDLLHPIIRALFDIFRLDPDQLDALDIRLKNIINEEAFAKTPVQDRIIVLPQCLRSIECPAQLSSKDGIQCAECGRCSIDAFKRDAEELGYKLYIVPGGTFVRRIIQDRRPKAVLGAGCFPDLIEGMRASEKAGIIPQGVLLDTLGCVETRVSWDRLYDKLYLGIARRQEL